MERGFGYRMLRGRQGAGGHVRSQGQREEITLRGLLPDEQYQLLSSDGGAVCLRSDGQGQVRYFSQRPGRYCIARGNEMILWEDEGRAEENYLQAVSWLKIRLKQNEPREKKGIPEPEKAEQPPEEIRKPADNEDKKPETAASISLPVQPVYSLRKPGNGAPADDLPALIWPEAAEKVRVYFDSLPPFSPFDIPGWRFVRAPSPVAGCPFCALGYREKEGRVHQIAWALPGGPHRPPANMPGYSYFQGRGGRGYWVLLQQVQ